MDVDLLRPGKVPICSDTVLWYEFLINEDLLLAHLQKPSPDPTPITLIRKFISVIFEYSNANRPIDLEVSDNKENAFEEQPKFQLRHFALQILSLKVVAFIKWNFETLKVLSFKFQLTILQDLLYFTSNQLPVDVASAAKCQDIPILSKHYLFALVLYHRWMLKLSLNYISAGQLRNLGNTEILMVEDSAIHSVDNIEKSVEFLREALKSDNIPSLITFDCFKMLTENNPEIENYWSHAIPISAEEYYAQINYDLAVFYFYKENYEAALSYLNSCLQHYRNCKTQIGFLNVDFDQLEGYILACSTVIDGTSLLLQQFYFSIVNQYMGILNILQQDNVHKEIPVFYRTCLELDISGALSSGKFTVARDLLPKIQALNATRCILDGTSMHNYELTIGNVDTFIWAIKPILKSCSNLDREHISSFLKQSILMSEESVDILNKLKTAEDITELLGNISSGQPTPQLEIPEFLTSQSKELVEFGPSVFGQKLEVRSIEQQIISSYDPQELRQHLLKLSAKNKSRPLWRINPCWELPIPLQSVLVAMPRGFLQDFCYILLAKSRELTLGKNWNLALELLSILKSEVQSTNSNTIQKLCRLTSWEVLLIKIHKLLNDWPASDLDKKELIQECEACLQPGESILPRTEIMEYCALCLINLGHWEFLYTYEKKLVYFEVASVTAAACQDLVKFKGNKKLPRDLWDIVLPMFGLPPVQTKRSSTGNTSIIHRDSPTSNSKPILMSFFLNLRDLTVLTLIVSLLARLYNVLRDESSLELSIDHIVLWPAVISNSTSYSSKSVLEVLMEILENAISFYPTNVAWIRLMGDVHFVNGHYEEALNSYLKSLIVSTDNFSIAFRNDDHVIRRMIKSCKALNCHTQAAVLCQFLEETDYTTAFQCLQEQKLCSDATDAYYHCFWDTSILEYLINLHHRKSEHQRRKQAIQIIGLLEINANNNDEIFHEASNLRKNVFLRALCKIYVH